MWIKSMNSFEISVTQKGCRLTKQAKIRRFNHKWIKQMIFM